MIRLPVPARLASSALVLVAAVGLTACGGGSPSAAPGSPAPTGSPAASDAVAGRTIRIEMTDAGCPPLPATIAAGPVTFAIVNKDSTKSSEAELVQGDRILGEKENLTPGLSASFSLELAAGDYEVYCPGATTERSPFTVTAAGAAPSGGLTSPATDAALAAASRSSVGWPSSTR